MKTIQCIFVGMLVVMLATGFAIINTGCASPDNAGEEGVDEDDDGEDAVDAEEAAQNATLSVVNARLQAGLNSAQGGGGALVKATYEETVEIQECETDGTTTTCTISCEGGGQINSVEEASIGTDEGDVYTITDTYVACAFSVCGQTITFNGTSVATHTFSGSHTIGYSTGDSCGDGDLEVEVAGSAAQKVGYQIEVLGDDDISDVDDENSQLQVIQSAQICIDGGDAQSFDKFTAFLSGECVKEDTVEQCVAEYEGEEEGEEEEEETCTGPTTECEGFALIKATVAETCEQIGDCNQTCYEENCMALGDDEVTACVDDCTVDCMEQVDDGGDDDNDTDDDGDDNDTDGDDNQTGEDCDGGDACEDNSNCADVGEACFAGCCVPSCTNNTTCLDTLVEQDQCADPSSEPDTACEQASGLCAVDCNGAADPDACLTFLSTFADCDQDDVCRFVENDTADCD